MWGSLNRTYTEWVHSSVSVVHGDRI